MRVTVWATHAGVGFHQWPGAPDPRSYLRDRHRHMFHIRVEVAVDHPDRAIEFHDLQDIIRAWWGPEPREWGAASCEHIARQLADDLEGFADLGGQVVAVEVSEDGENGAIVRVRS